uniref:Uncharacterized protein n=1 Tax=Arundo donax TaxID=35708 RepID=A0A0A8YA31_ARUDO
MRDVWASVWCFFTVFISFLCWQ